jgi:hypothetical protein
MIDNMAARRYGWMLAPEQVQREGELTQDAHRSDQKRPDGLVISSSILRAAPSGPETIAGLGAPSMIAILAFVYLSAGAPGIRARDCRTRPLVRSLEDPTSVRLLAHRARRRGLLTVDDDRLLDHATWLAERVAESQQEFHLLQIGGGMHRITARAFLDRAAAAAEQRQKHARRHDASRRRKWVRQGPKAKNLPHTPLTRIVPLRS